MSAAIPQLPPRYLRTPEAARFLGLSGRTLEKHRTYGTGPPMQFHGQMLQQSLLLALRQCVHGILDFGDRAHIRKDA